MGNSTTSFVCTAMLIAYGILFGVVYCLYQRLRQCEKPHGCGKDNSSHTLFFLLIALFGELGEQINKIIMEYFDSVVKISDFDFYHFFLSQEELVILYKPTKFEESELNVLHFEDYSTEHYSYADNKDEVIKFMDKDTVFCCELTIDNKKYTPIDRNKLICSKNFIQKIIYKK